MPMQLTDYQKVDQLLKMGDLGASRSLELLAAMLELCPPGQETSLFFTHLFLCRCLQSCASCWGKITTRM